MNASAVIYCRVSTKEQAQNLSLAVQERECRSYCQRQGFHVDKVFVEEGESAKTVNRREFQKMLLYCGENKKKIGYVVVYALSRFSRHTTDHHQVRALLSGFGVRLRSATEPIDESSSGQFIETMISAVAQFDNDQRSERTVAGMKAATEAGRWMFQAPIGYRMVTTSGHSCLEHDPGRAPLIRKSFELFASGRYEQEQVLRKVTAEGLTTRRGKRLSVQTFSRMLRKPIYAGRITVPRWGIDQLGDFPPIVTQDVFFRVQEILAGRRVPTVLYDKQNPDFPLRRFVRCARCDKPLTGSFSKGRSQRYPYYKCPRSQCRLNVSKTRIENQFIDLMKMLQPKPKYLRLFEAIVLDVWKQERAQTHTTKEGLTKRLDQIRERSNKLTEAFVYNQSIDRETYQTQLARLREEQLLIEMELNETRVEELDVESAVNFALFAIGDASRFWIEASLDQKQRFQQSLFPEGLAFDGKEFGTARTCLAFSYLRQISSRDSRLASRTGIEPVSPP